MADIRCPHCGKDNPDFFDVCQFCQSPLNPDAMVHIGEEPTEKDTGELEEILPDWLRDARQQGKNVEGADEAFQSQTRPKVPKEEPPDLLAGLMSQSDSDEDEVPDWLTKINPVAGKETPAKEEDDSSDFFAQFRQAESQPPSEGKPEQEETPVETGMEQTSSRQSDDLTDWFSQSSSNQGADAAGGSTLADSWMSDLGSFNASEPEQPVDKEPEDLSWLHDLEAASKGTDNLPSSQEESGFDFPSSSSSDGDLSWLDNLGGTPVSGESASSQPASSEEDLSWLNNLGGTPEAAPEEPAPAQPASSDEDLSWLNNLGGTPVSEEAAPSYPTSSDEDLDWLNKLGGTSEAVPEEPAPPQPASSNDDLSWLHDLGDAPTPGKTVQLQPESSKEDMDWLNNLGGTSESVPEEPAPAQPTSSDDDLSWLSNLGDTSKTIQMQPESSQEDLDWLNNLGGTSEAAPEEPAPSQPVSSDEDMSWLDNLGGTTVSGEATPSQPASSQEDLDWLKNLSETSEAASEEPVPSQPASSQDDLDWLSSLGEASETTDEASSAFADENVPQTPENISGTSPKPFRTAPLRELVGDEPIDNTPDWLKSAMEEPSMPPPGAVSMDWFSEHEKTGEKEQEEGVPDQEEPVTSPPAFDYSVADSSEAPSQDVDSLFSEMPEWLSREPEEGGTPQHEPMPESAGDDTLSPVELPSWVQAMRPVDSAIGDATAVDEADQIVESEGPLAGFRGVLPFAPIGSSLRPKAFSLKLQITEEQEASASLLEQIIASETTSQPRKSVESVSPQKVLRWVLSALFILVLGGVLALGSHSIPIAGSNQQSNLIDSIPDASSVLVVVDYEPSFTGELEASAGPLLDQLAFSRRSSFTFVSMSPNGTALVDHLMFNTGISKPDGLGYQLGQQYFNLGFLPGGSAGVLGFIENPVDEFAKFSAVVLMTDNAETGRVWVEQLSFAKGKYSSLAGKPLIVVSSAQSAPLMQPYVSSGQVDLMVNGLYDAAKYEFMNNTRPGIARAYWDAFGFGLMMTIIVIVMGSLWSVVVRIRENRAEAEQG